MAVQGDQAFEKQEFLDYLQSHGISFRLVPSRKQHKNSLPKHGIISSIFILLVHASSDTSKSLLEFSAINISNYLYGSNFMSSLNIAKGFTKPLVYQTSPESVSKDLVNARDNPIAK